jgi:predicted GTPase
MLPKNIVLFGQTGAGKSSVVNLIAGEYRAPTSPDMNRCTMDWKEYPITFDGCDYRVFDTVGLMEPQLGSEEHPDAIENARTLIKELDNEGGIDLLIFCVRPRRSTAAIENNYRRFCTELLRKKKIPIILVVTGLEGEEIMEDWWLRNKDTFDQYNIVLDGHACIIAASLDGRHQRLYEESRQLVRDLIKEHAQGISKIRAVLH